MLENIIAGIIIVLCAIYFIKKIYQNFKRIDEGKSCDQDKCSSCPYNNGECTPEDKNHKP